MMKRIISISAFLVVAISLFFIFGCSTTKSPVESNSFDYQSINSNLPDSMEVQFETRSTIAVYEASIDPIEGTFNITPIEREVSGHLPLSQLYPTCLQIVDYGFTPNLWVDLKLQHPFPESGVDAFDPRVIAILPANTGVRFYYPTASVGGNNRVVLDPDGYTKLFDEIDGNIPGNVNPFIAYFKDEPYCRWSSTGNTTETIQWKMDINRFGGAMQWVFVVDVSTNYPNPPTPVNDNAPEPVWIKASVGTGLMSDGGSADIEVTLKDWQGPSSILAVGIEAPALFNGIKLLFKRGQRPIY